MKTKNISKFVILSLIILFGMTISIEIATAQPNPVPATSDNINDPQGDVIILSFSTLTCEETSLHDELDIDSVVRSGQTFTITLYELFSEIPLSGGYLNVFMIEDGSDVYTAAYIDVLDMVTFVTDEGDNWDGSAWSTGMPASVGSVSGKTLTIQIPTAALTITNSMEWNFATYFTDPVTSVMYIDMAPDSELPGFCPGTTTPDDDDDGNGDASPDDDGDGSSIPGYEFMSLLLITSFTVSGIIYIYLKKNKFK